MLPRISQEKIAVGIKVIVPPPVVNGATAVIVDMTATPEIKVMLLIGAIVAALAIVVAAAVVPVIPETASEPLNVALAPSQYALGLPSPSLKTT